MNNYTITFIKENCIRCHSCSAACSSAHGGRKIIALDNDGYPAFCRHCSDAPCALVCPAGAILKENGAIILHPLRCVSCSSCAIACPIGALDFNLPFSFKCDLCLGMSEDTENPVFACVSACPTGAISIKLIRDEEI